MLYELMVGRRPFTADGREALFAEIQAHDPKPPRQIDRGIPRELERICLKCLSKRRMDRYNTTDDLRADLVTWLGEKPSVHAPQSSVIGRLPEASSSAVRPAKIIPKGLRSFEADDADFFLELLPGPRDRDGLPESIRFWKHRIEETDADKTFSVGLIYGPSGCGKSSLVKAGLLPRLSDQVLPIYLEATAADTEARILKQLGKHIPRLPEHIRLPEACAVLRQQGAGHGRKVLLVIDQFEQWLHAHAQLRNCPLVDALRQCDGERLQAMLLVRDDFFASVHGLFQELESPLLEGSNYALVDRFDKDHARKVLTAFGRAFGKVDDELSREQEKFIAQAVDDLAEDNKVISVRLGLFADMLKMRPWLPSSLHALGGVGGVGVAFLEETLSAKTAPPSHRVHQQAIRRVLRVLLPTGGGNIKGAMQSTEQLCAASGYQPGRQFDELLHILDGELRLITPADPEAHQYEADGGSHSYYQLTHDYLVPALREWLTLKQKETRRGRAQLRLAERSAAWNAKPEKRQLPNVIEWISIRGLTAAHSWSDSERRMMRAARRHYLARLALVAVLAIFAIRLAYDVNGRLHAGALTRGLMNAQEDAVLGFANQLQPYLRWARPELEEVAGRDAQTRADRQQQLHAQLALVAMDDAYVREVYAKLLGAEPLYLGPICHALRPYREQLVADLWAELHQPTAPAARRFRAGLALAEFASESPAWTRDDFAFLAHQLIVANPDHQSKLRKSLSPIRKQLVSDLERFCMDGQLSESQLLGAANALAEFAQDDPRTLERVLSKADLLAFPVVLPSVHAALHPTESQPLADLWAELHEPAISVDRRFRAGLALAVHAAESDQWTDDDFAFLANQLINTSYADHQMTKARTYLRLVRQHVVPHLEKMCLNDELPDLQLLLATNALADLAKDDATCLARVLVGVNSTQYKILFPVLGHRASDWLAQEVSRQPADELSEPDRVELGKRRADAAITLLRQGARDEVFDVLRVRDDPESLTQFVHRCRERDINAQQLLECLRAADRIRQDKRDSERALEDRVMCGLLLALGEYPPDELPRAEREMFVADLADWYATDPSSVIHGAAGWLLRNWGYEETTRTIDQTPVPYVPGREWFTQQIDIGAAVGSSLGHETAKLPQTFYLTFVVFPAGEYEVGSPEVEADRRDRVERLHRVTITRPFALLDREVTMAEFSAFDPGYLERLSTVYHEEGSSKRVIDRRLDASNAANTINWYDSVRFCRWLTKQAGWLEEDQPYPAPTLLDQEEFPADADPLAGGAPENWPLHLDRRGFRLPTVDEWEIACRAGTRSRYGFGCDVALLEQYGWVKGRSGDWLHEVRMRKPSLAGLFDMHGNVLEWCHDWYGNHQLDGAIDPTEPSALILQDAGPKVDAKRRVSRGGCWRFASRYCRSAYQCSDRPYFEFDRLGLRLAVGLPAKPGPLDD